jgi:hypothetical protein
VKRDVFANDNVAREEPLVMERPRRHRPTTDPEKVMDVVESIHEQLSLQELTVGLGDDDVILDATRGRQEASLASLAVLLMIVWLKDLQCKWRR